jgi:cytochrome c2
MKRSLQFAAFSFALLALAPRAASAQDAKAGHDLFVKRSCSMCHTIGKGRLAGPDLKGVTERRSSEWLHKWLSNTSEMLASDSTAKALLAENRGIKMPNVKLTEPEIENVLAYITSESAKVKEK